MNPLNLFRRPQNVSQIANRSEIVSRYKRLRAAAFDLNNRLVTRLSKEAMLEGARKLGMLRRGTLVFDSEDQSAVLMDYCLYDVRFKGRNVIEEYLIESPPDSESDEMTCLRAKQHTIYSLFVVESVERGFGVRLRDLRSNEVHLVVDMGLGSSARPGLVLASRLLFYDDLATTGGAALPIGVLAPDQLPRISKKLMVGIGPQSAAYFDPAPLIRSCLNEGASSHVAYRDPVGHTMREPHIAGQRQLLGSDRPNAVPRNAPCPCGSGKKFKNCCLRRE